MNTISNMAWWLNSAKNDSESVQKICKIITLSNKAVTVLTNDFLEVSSKALIPLSELAKSTNVVAKSISGLNIFNRMNEWLSKSARTPAGKKDYPWKFRNKRTVTKNVFELDKYWSGSKTASRVFLTAAHTIGFAKFLEGFKVVALHPLSGIAQGLIYVPTALCTLGSDYQVHRDANTTVSNADHKVQNWTNKLEVLNGNDPEKKAELLEKYTVKLESAGKDSKTEDKIRKYEAYIAAFTVPGNNNNEQDGSVKDADAAKEYCELKLKKWTKVQDTVKKNAEKIKTKNWLDVANNTGKLAFGIFGLVGFFMGISTLPAFMLAFSVGWIVTESFGLAKWAYSKMESSKTVPVSHKIETIHGMCANKFAAV